MGSAATVMRKDVTCKRLRITEERPHRRHKDQLNLCPIFCTSSLKFPTELSNNVIIFRFKKLYKNII